MPERIGQQLGNYRLVRLLGRGGFAEVYLGEHRYLKSYAALKVLLTSLKDDDVERFLSEAQMLVRLMHPNIVRVLEFAVDRGTPVLIMDYAPGGSLRQRHPKGTYLSLAMTVAYTKRVAAALQYAHNHNVIHRDVKPENILLGSGQQLLLSDFGIALFNPSPELLNTPGMAGTLPYTAPEQLRGNPSFASDQYSLAIVVYEWLCGVRPFEGSSGQIIHQHLGVQPPSLRDKFPELPAAVEDVVLKALAKDPQQRFVSVLAFAHALERASQGSGAVVLFDDSEITTPLKESSHSPYITPSDRTSRWVFLTASDADKAFATRLKADLGTRGVQFWDYNSQSTLDTTGQEDVVRQAIRAAHVALVVASPGMRSSRALKEHLRIASIYGRQLVFVWAEGNDIAEVLPEAWGRTAVIDLIDARQPRYETALDEIVAYLEEEASGTHPLPPLHVGQSSEPRNPYKGLRAFGRDDTADFFGRNALVQDLIQTLNGFLTSEEPGIYEARLLTLIGPSGSGKSSVVMAGLLPQLQSGVLPGSEEWVYLEPMMPGKKPLEALALTLAPRLPNWSLRSIQGYLEDESARALHLLASQLVKHQSMRVVLIVDQFEELFASTSSEEERQHFIELLVTAVTWPRGHVVVLLTLRADFYDRPLSFPELGLLIQDHHRVLLPMDIEDLRAVIERPAALSDVQLTFEGNLVGDLLFEAQGQAGALPLLEFTLDQLFQQRNGHWLTQQAYKKIGGVKGALAKHAESTYASLPSDEHRRLARALFLRLIDPGVTEQDTTRRRAALTELALPDPKQTIIIQAVADAFIDARLLTTNETAGTTTIEVSHEALIREWTRLSEWLRAAREDISLQQSISADAADWIRRGKPMDRLYRGTKLVEAQAWVERNLPSTEEVAFLQASAADLQQQEEFEQSRQARELNLQRRVVNRQRILITALSLFSVIVIVLGSVAGLNYLRAEDQRQQADHARQLTDIQAHIARSQALAANSSYALVQKQLDQALLLSVKAEQTYDTFEARNSLLNALVQSPHIVTILRGGSNPVNTLAFSSDGSTLLSSDGSTIFMWDTPKRTGHPLQLKGSPPILGSTAISPDHRTLVTSSAFGVTLWNVQTGLPTQLAPQIPNLPMFLGLGTSTTFSADGTLVASGRCSQRTIIQGLPTCLETQISIWNVQSTQLAGPVIVIPADVKNIAFNPDGKSLVSASHAGIQFWDISTGQALGPPLTNSVGANSIAFSPDGKTLAAGRDNKTVQIWDVATGALLGSPFVGHSGPVLSVAFSPDGKTLATGSEDKTILLWDVATGLPETTFASDAQPKTSVAFSPDGKTLASGNQDGTIILWNISADSPISHRLADTSGVRSVLFSADGKIVFTGSENGKVLLQNAQTGKLLATFDTNSYPLLAPQNAQGKDLAIIQSLALGGTTLAAARLDGAIFVWDLSSRKLLALFKHPALLHKVSLSSDGHILASGGDGGTIMLWDVAKKSVIRSLHTDYQLSALPVALSPDGRVLAAGFCARKGFGNSCQQVQALLWDVRTGNLIDRLDAGSQYEILDVAFSPDGHILAASSYAGIKMWNVTTGKPIGATLTIPGSNSSTDYYSNILFSPDGKMLASYSAPGSPFDFVLWDVAQHELFAHAINEVDSSFGSVAFSPNGHQLASVFDRSGEGNFLLWDITTSAWQDQACKIANRNLTGVEWSQFVKDGTLSRVCPGLPFNP